MFKYVKFNPVETEFTTLTFKQKNDDVKVNFFNLPIVSLESDDEALIDELIKEQPSEIECELITKEEFSKIAKTTVQYKRILQVGNEKLAELTADIDLKYPLNERETWHIQLEEARKYLETKDEQDAPFVSILALNEDRSVEDFCNAIILNDKNYRTLAANALSEKRILENTLASEIGI